ncbi:hypothetical protein LARV_03779 [Longilinea arvoryzae]|uniref:N-acetyltransferase domain-containing protein n=1 Tax=Longilinea arvoryzae TaxID=360412 RepID=A0A0K8MXL2_9CHLR|nr:GNAT family N-acetyltransferase [Longilinea arvoryzae]GAP15984.1 hypothetical protein LARV_03779 [Longilinea arvoryzae]
MITFEKFEERDIEVLTPILKRAFDEDTRIHLNRPEGGPEGYANGEFLRKWAFHEGVTSFKILVDGKTAGSTFLWINPQTHVNFLGNVYLDVVYQNQGLGQQVWEKIEALYPDTRVWQTETPGFSRRNHYFYVMKCGFKIVRIENPRDLLEANYIFEKVMQ